MVKEKDDVVEFVKNDIEQIKENIQNLKSFASEHPNHIPLKDYIKESEQHLANQRKALKRIVGSRKLARARTRIVCPSDIRTEMRA